MEPEKESKPGFLSRLVDAGRTRLGSSFGGSNATSSSTAMGRAVSQPPQQLQSDSQEQPQQQPHSYHFSPYPNPPRSSQPEYLQVPSYRMDSDELHGGTSDRMASGPLSGPHSGGSASSTSRINSSLTRSPQVPRTTRGQLSTPSSRGTSMISRPRSDPQTQFDTARQSVPDTDRASGGGSVIPRRRSDSSTQFVTAQQTMPDTGRPTAMHLPVLAPVPESVSTASQQRQSQELEQPGSSSQQPEPAKPAPARPPGPSRLLSVKPSTKAAQKPGPPSQSGTTGNAGELQPAGQAEESKPAEQAGTSTPAGQPEAGASKPPHGPGRLIGRPKGGMLPAPLQVAGFSRSSDPDPIQASDTTAAARRSEPGGPSRLSESGRTLRRSSGGLQSQTGRTSGNIPLPSIPRTPPLERCNAGRWVAIETGEGPDATLTFKRATTADNPEPVEDEESQWLAAVRSMQLRAKQRLTSEAIMGWLPEEARQAHNTGGGLYDAPGGGRQSMVRNSFAHGPSMRGHGPNAHTAAHYPGHQLPQRPSNLRHQPYPEYGASDEETAKTAAGRAHGAGGPRHGLARVPHGSRAQAVGSHAPQRLPSGLLASTRSHRAATVPHNAAAGGRVMSVRNAATPRLVATGRSKSRSRSRSRTPDISDEPLLLPTASGGKQASGVSSHRSSASGQSVLPSGPSAPAFSRISGGQVDIPLTVLEIPEESAGDLGLSSTRSQQTRVSSPFAVLSQSKLSGGSDSERHSGGAGSGSDTGGRKRKAGKEAWKGAAEQPPADGDATQVPSLITSGRPAPLKLVPAGQAEQDALDQELDLHDLAHNQRHGNAIDDCIMTSAPYDIDTRVVRIQSTPQSPSGSPASCGVSPSRRNARSVLGAAGFSGLTPSGSSMRHPLLHRPSARRPALPPQLHNLLRIRGTDAASPLLMAAQSMQRLGAGPAHPPTTLQHMLPASMRRAGSGDSPAPRLGKSTAAAPASTTGSFRSTLRRASGRMTGGGGMGMSGLGAGRGAGRGALGGLALAVGSFMQKGEWTTENGFVCDSGEEVGVYVPPGLQQVDPDDLNKVCELGRGQFGSVWLALWCGVEVALKELHQSVMTDSQQQEIFSEAERLAALRHPCVIAFYGIVTTSPDCYATVVEFCRTGNLKSGLTALRGKDTVTPSVKASIALQAARGMEYLHSQGVVHFDLKGENLLCDLRDLARPVVKIGDLGLSKLKEGNAVKGKMQGTLPWMAPELFPGGGVPSPRTSRRRRRRKGKRGRRGQGRATGRAQKKECLPWEDSPTAASGSGDGGKGPEKGPEKLPWEDDDDDEPPKTNVDGMTVNRRPSVGDVSMAGGDDGNGDGAGGGGASGGGGGGGKSREFVEPACPWGDERAGETAENGSEEDDDDDDDWDGDGESEWEDEDGTADSGDEWREEVGELDDEHVTEAVDVYSFAIVLWEIWTLGETPYQSVERAELISGIMNGRLRPEIPEDCDPDWAKLMKDCWSARPSKRPTFTQMAARLQALIQKYNDAAAAAAAAATEEDELAAALAAAQAAETAREHTGRLPWAMQSPDSGPPSADAVAAVLAATGAGTPRVRVPARQAHSSGGYEAPEDGRQGQLRPVQSQSMMRTGVGPAWGARTGRQRHTSSQRSAMYQDEWHSDGEKRLSDGQSGMSEHAEQPSSGKPSRLKVSVHGTGDGDVGYGAGPQSKLNIPDLHLAPGHDYHHHGKHEHSSQLSPIQSTSADWSEIVSPSASVMTTGYGSHAGDSGAHAKLEGSSWRRNSSILDAAAATMDAETADADKELRPA